jgi:hypothetical protein
VNAALRERLLREHAIATREAASDWLHAWRGAREGADVLITIDDASALMVFLDTGAAETFDAFVARRLEETRAQGAELEAAIKRASGEESRSEPRAVPATPRTEKMEPLVRDPVEREKDAAVGAWLRGQLTKRAYLGKELFVHVARVLGVERGGPPLSVASFGNRTDEDVGGALRARGVVAPPTGASA